MRKTGSEPITKPRGQCHDDHVVAKFNSLLRLEGTRATLQSLDGATYRLTSPTGARSASVGPKPSSILLKHDEASWRLHLGLPDALHRVVSFTARRGGTK